MKRWVVVAALALVMSVASASGAAPSTVISTWNPFDDTGRVKAAFKVERVGQGTCGPGSDVLGGNAYRCGTKHGVADPCWRDGRRNDRVICTRNPWMRNVTMMRVPDLLFAAGITFALPINPKRDAPWAVELADGHRCAQYQGAHGSLVIKGRRLSIDYLCVPDDIALLQNPVRARVWRITAVRSAGRRRQPHQVAIRRAVFASMAPAVQRQNDVARKAARQSGFPLARVLLVRLRLPVLDWAYVQALAPIPSQRVVVWRVVHRRGHNWRVVRVREPACRDGDLPFDVRRQLFDCS